MEQTIQINPPSPQIDLAHCLFDKWASWLALATEGRDNILDGQLQIRIHDPKDIRLTWTAAYGSRPNPSAPTVTELAIPISEIYEAGSTRVKQSAWEFKSMLVNHFLQTGNVSLEEPLRSPFFRSLAQMGYQIISMSNACVSDPTEMKLNLAPVAKLSNLKLSVNTLLKAKELHLENVHFDNCKINFEVGGGVWKNCRATGSNFHFFGNLGATIFDEQTSFSDGYLQANCVAAKFSGDIRRYFSGMTLNGAEMPPEVAAILGKSISGEQQSALNARIVSTKFKQVAESKITKPVDSMGSQPAISQQFVGPTGRV